MKNDLDVFVASAVLMLQFLLLKSSESFHFIAAAEAVELIQVFQAMQGSTEEGQAVGGRPRRAGREGEPIPLELCGGPLWSFVRFLLLQPTSQTGPKCAVARGALDLPTTKLHTRVIPVPARLIPAQRMNCIHGLDSHRVSAHRYIEEVPGRLVLGASQLACTGFPAPVALDSRILPALHIYSRCTGYNQENEVCLQTLFASLLASKARGGFKILQPRAKVVERGQTIKVRSIT